MRFNRYPYIATAVFTFLLALSATAYVMAEEPQKDTAINKNKTEIVKDMESFEKSLNNTRSCISEATTAAELEKCHIGETLSRFQQIHDALSEIGMSPDERRLYELRPQK